MMQCKSSCRASSRAGHILLMSGRILREGLTPCSAKEDLEELSSLGHFLKGSSATLGLVRVRDGCEKIQRFGKLENEDGSSEPDAALCLQRIRDALAAIKTDYQDVETRLRAYYEDDE